MDLKTLMLPLGPLWDKLVKCIPAIVAEVEKAMQDGRIDAAERKALALKVVDVVASEFGIKFGWIARMVIGWIIDAVARKLPSKAIVIPAAVITAMKEIK